MPTDAIISMHTQGMLFPDVRKNDPTGPLVVDCTFASRQRKPRCSRSAARPPWEGRGHAVVSSVVVAITLIWSALVASFIPSRVLVEAFSEGQQWSHASSLPYDSKQRRTPSLFVSTSAVPEEGSYQSFHPSSAATTTTTTTTTTASKKEAVFRASLSAIQKLKRNVTDLSRQRNHARAFESVQLLFDVLKETNLHHASNERLELSAAVDIALQEYVVVSLASNDPVRVMYAVETLNRQLTSRALHPRYRSIPRSTVIAAINTLTKLGGVTVSDSFNSDDNPSRCPLDESYRLLQRLVTGTGVRTVTAIQSANATTKANKPTTIVQHRLHEREFVQVLNAFCNAGDMTMAHRIVALQERTPHAPPLSPVAYSVLLKGYSRRHDLRNVQAVLQKAQVNRIQPDVVMLNSLIDAYINCNDMNEAERVFIAMKDGSVMPNRRTYNIILKGWAKGGNLRQAQKVSLEMKQLKLWDSVTTNTLVDAAVSAGEFAYAEQVLTLHTMRSSFTQRHSNQHPNVQAYTEMIDAYCKSDQLDRALALLQTMRERDVDPNEITYTCLMAGFGRSDKIDLAHKTFDYMELNGIRPTTKLYNSLITGLVTGDTYAVELDDRVDTAMKVLQKMMRVGVRPNSYTASVLLDAMGRCRVPRITEAKLLVEKLEQQNAFSVGNVKVATALVRTCGRNGEIQEVLDAFKKVTMPDAVAVNAFMDSCCRCNQDKLAVQAFELYFRKNSMIPDVISYSVLIGSCLKGSSTESRRRARNLYQEMKSRKIFPDNGLIDVILKALIRDGASHSLNKPDVRFILSVVKDAEALVWTDEQLDRRKRAVRSVLTNGARDSWRNDEIPADSPLASVSDDGLFARKGWNKVDSGFRLWGGGYAAAAQENHSSGTKANPGPCTFLESHGWNNVNSGFRLF